MRPWVIARSPFREVVLKIHERCNLACDYCYMYEAADQHWRDRPISMGPSTVGQVARRLADHVRTHQLDSVRVVLHGGEPLLAGVEAIADALRQVRSAVDAHCAVDFSLQTNGVRLDHRFLELFHQYNVGVGISTDGGQAAHDRHRRFPNGQGSYAAVQRAIGLLTQPEHRRLFAGLLCTIDIRNDPVETLESLLASAPPRIDLLLPHGNWTYPPPAIEDRGSDREGVPTPYAGWLIAVFDHWARRDDGDLEVRLFESIIAGLYGRASATEAFGVGVPSSLVVESDGSIEGNDALKTTGPDGGATAMTVYSHSFDEAMEHPVIADSRSGLAGLAPTCQECPVVAACGGGLYAHRFRTSHGFRQPSVYCADLYRVINHISTRLTHVGPEPTRLATLS